MKVQFLVVLGGNDVMYVPNEVYDLPKETALRYIEHGICLEYHDGVKEEIKELNSSIGTKKPKAKVKK